MESGATTRWLLVTLCAGWMAGCAMGVDNAFPGRRDAEMLDPDGGPSDDAALPDAGLPARDGGPLIRDAGSLPDAGVMPDGGFDGGFDAGSFPDASGHPDAGHPDAGFDGGFDAGPPPPPPGSCPFAGTWRFQSVTCAGTDYTSSFLAPGVTMRITYGHRDAGGCTLHFVLSGPSCTETEDGTMMESGAAWTMWDEGITSCMPAGCRFSAEDYACRLGDRRGTIYASLRVEGDRLLDTRTTSDVACATIGRLPQVMTWVRE